MNFEQPMQNGRRLLNLFQRGEEWLEISGYNVGDIFSNDKPVAITRHATIVGNVFAPKVSVVGLLCGSVVTRAGVIESTGQIWGDVFAIQIELKNGGKIQGWISSIDADLYDELMQNQSLPDEQGESPSGETIDSHLLKNRDHLELITLHQLQTEIATALAARTELENSFEKRLSEVAGDAAGRVATLSSQLDETRTNLLAIQADLKEQSEALKDRETQVERQSKELAVSRQLIDDQTAEIEQLQQTKAQLEQSVNQLSAERDSLSSELEEKLQQLETQAARIRTLETTMQAGLQHSAELEESLMRWQELAEATEKKVKELEQKASNAQFKLEESSKLVEMLREQKQQAEHEWERLQIELEQQQKHPTRPIQAGEDADASDVRRIDELELALTNLEQDHAEQILWYRANLETNQAELARVRRIAEEQQIKLDLLQGDYNKARSMVDKWKTAADEISTQLREQEKQFKQWRQEADENIASLQAQLNQKRLQLEAVEEDLVYHVEAIEKQGSHLAEIQATLAERETQLLQARELILKQNRALKQLREKAEDQIRKLHARIQQVTQEK